MFLSAFLAACAPSGRDNGGNDGPDNCTLTCGDQCVDSDTDPANCGSCGNVCTSGTCADGLCVESACTPGASENCYTGPVGTDQVGTCHGGARVCEATGTWSACENQVLPAAEICGNGLDENCSGTADEAADVDGDGYTTCDGDCCDSGSACTNPQWVNPGAIDVDGNNLDDDCDGTKDNAPADAACDTGLSSTSGDPMDYARAMELCQTASETDVGPNKRWGVVSAKLVLADGTGLPAVDGRSILTSFGGTTVQAGQSFALFSTGHSTPNATDSFWWQSGTSHGQSSGPPADFLAANGGAIPSAPGCNLLDSALVNDPVMLELKIRTPSNAKSFSFSSNFFSAEYPEWVCSSFNDFFVVLLDSTFAGTPANPADKNLAIYKAPAGQTYPIGVNLAHGDTGLFRECQNGPVGCSGVAGNATTCTGTSGLTGTGFDYVSGDCQTGGLTGGATGWLQTAGNVKGGEIITLRIAVWDTGDSSWDSLVILDNFKWSLDAATPGTVIE